MRDLREFPPLMKLRNLGFKYLVIEKGLIGNTIYNYPVGLTVFSTTNELEFEEGDLQPAREKPTREELLSYYVRFVLDNDLNVQTEETVEKVEQIGEHHFKVISDKGEYEARNVLFAHGAMDFPRKLGVKGEDLPKVHDHFRRNLSVGEKEGFDRRRRKFGRRSGTFSC